MHLVTITIYFLSSPPLTWRCEAEVRTSPPPPMAVTTKCSVGWVLMVKSDYNYYNELSQKVLQFSLGCHMDLWLHCGSHLIIVIISLLHHPLRKSKVDSCFRLSFFLFSARFLGCLELFSNSHLSVGEPVHPPAWLPWKPYELSGLKPVYSPWFYRERA
jgi:hypothetical protein